MSATKVETNKKERWGQFIKDVWNDILAQWRLIQNYKQKRPVGPFFQITFNAIQDNFLIKLADAIDFCEKISKVVEPGQVGMEKLRDLKQICDKGRASSKGRCYVKTDLGNVGVRAYRDLIVAHRVNRIKFLQAQPEYRLTLAWETVEQTINKLREFCMAVQEFHVAEWNCEWSIAEIEAVDDIFDSLIITLKEGSKYNQLRMEVLNRGNPRIEYDHKTKEFRLSN